MLCDFCNVPDPVVEYASDVDVKIFVEGKTEGHFYGNWMICNDCALLIDNSDWSGLIERFEKMCVNDVTDEDKRAFIVGWWKRILLLPFVSDHRRLDR